MARAKNKPQLVDEDVARSWTLPSSLYTDAAVLEREKKAIFKKTWQIVGRLNQVAKPGDYFTTELAGEPLLITRDQKGDLRGFYNVCSHRAGPPATGCGSRKVFRCGYHGWTYNLEGKLLNAPEMEHAEDFRHEEFGLRAVKAEAWGAWLFVNLATPAPTLRDALGELPEQAARFKLGKLRFVERREYVMECNWKVYVDNYLEGYHLPSVHPGLNRELDYAQYETELFVHHSRQSSPIRGPENESSTTRRYRQAKGDEVAEYYWVYPNWMLNCYPDNVSVNIVLPISADKTIASFEWYAHEGADRDSIAEGVKFSDQIQIEDAAICEAVHKNLRSSAYERGRLAPSRSEGYTTSIGCIAERCKLDGSGSG